MIIKWKIEKLIHDVSDRFIKFALLKVTATQIDLNGNVGKHSAEMFATAHFTRHSDLIPYEQLNESQVMKWAKDKVNLDKINDPSIMNISDCEKYVVSKLHEKINPSEMEGFPWVENSIQPIQDN